VAKIKNMNQDIVSVAEALEKLGFDTSLHTTLNTYVSLQLPKFSISYKTVKERDVIKFNLFFQRKENAYSCLYYDANLRKEIVFADTIIDNIHISDLDEEMKSINWNEVFNRSQDIASIINDLQKLSLTKEGKELAEQLKVKYWSDTALENIMGISFIKSRYEIAQRFYFLENGTGISIEEAYRFLNNKWMERQLRRKSVTVVAPKPSTKSKKSKSSKS
jgi:hypothetical protein